MGVRFRAFDWSATPLGAVEDWSPELRSAAAYVLESRFPAALVWGEGLVTIYNDGFRPILGQKPEALGRSFADIWSEAWQEIGPIAERALAGESTFIEDYPLVIDRFGTPETAYFTFSYSPVRSADGRVMGMIDTVVETTGKVVGHEKLQRSEAHQRVLLAELQHRVRNTLAVVRSIVRRTSEHSLTIEENTSHLVGRINAFARVQSEITMDPSAGVDLAMLVAEELLAADGREGDNVDVQGPRLMLDPRAAEVLALAIHELTTNAIKHGALTETGGHVAVRWALEGDALDFSWTESGMKGLEREPARRGFGRDILEKTLTYELKAQTKLAIEETGLQFVARIPLPSLLRPGTKDA